MSVYRFRNSPRTEPCSPLFRRTGFGPRLAASKKLNNVILKKESMLKINKISLAAVSLVLGTLSGIPLSFAADSYNSNKTTTVEQTTVQTTSTPPRPVVKKVAPVTTSTTTTLTTTDGDLRKVLDEDALKKMSDTLCVEGFKASVGNDTKNVCQGKATAPDIAYSCVWKDDGNAAYPQTPQGPCTLDYAVHQDSIIVTKNDYASNPPLPYGSEAQCCFRAAKGPTTSTVETSPTTTVPK